jgi:small-conductance mechanosensitive channel
LRPDRGVPHNPNVSQSPVRGDELQAAIEARKELGAELEPELIDGFVERIERRLAARGGQNEQALKRKRDHQKEMVLGAMGISVPIFVIAAIFAGLAGIIAVGAVIAVIAIVSAR